MWFCSSIASLEFVTRDNGFPRGFDGHEVRSSQQLVAGEIRKAEGVAGKNGLQFEAKGLQSGEATPMAITHVAPCPRYPKN